MVDSITPATDSALRSSVAQALELQDAWPVQRERFVQWVVEETDCATQPDWASVGVTLSRDVSAYERAKLRLLNGAHSTLAYLGLLAGLRDGGAGNGGACPARIHRAPDDRGHSANAHGPAAARNSPRTEQSILQRFENPAIRHQLAQIAWDGSQKLPIRLLGTIDDAIRAHRPLARLALAVAAWMPFIRSRVALGQTIVDPLCEQLTACGLRATGDSKHDLPMFLNLPGVFPAGLSSNADFVPALGRAYDLIARGPLAAAASS